VNWLTKAAVEWTLEKLKEGRESGADLMREIRDKFDIPGVVDSKEIMEIAIKEYRIIRLEQKVRNLETRIKNLEQGKRDEES